MVSSSSSTTSLTSKQRAPTHESHGGRLITHDSQENIQGTNVQLEHNEEDSLLERHTSEPLAPNTTPSDRAHDIRPPASARQSVSPDLGNVHHQSTFAQRRDTQRSVSLDKIFEHGIGDEKPLLRAHTGNSRRGEPLDLTGSRPGIDWIVPAGPTQSDEKTIGERLDPTLQIAIAEKDKHAWKARVTGYALNIAIGLQVMFGALITALAATHSAPTSTAVLGGFSTLVASYLARARGSREPEKSNVLVKDLEQFIRECQAFKMDHGHVVGNKFNHKLEHFRRHLEEIIGNTNQEYRSSSPA